MLRLNANPETVHRHSEHEGTIVLEDGRAAWGTNVMGLGLESERTVKFKSNARGLDVIQSVYAFAVALGLTQVFTGSQTFLTRILSGTAPLAAEKTVLVLLLFINVAMLGLRFFWVPRNLQGLVTTAARAFSIAPERGSQPGDLLDRVIAVHLLIIFLHGALFYLICAEFEFIVFAISSNLPLSSGVFVGYISMHALLLLMNAAWIARVRQQEIGFEDKIRMRTGAPERPSAGSVWWRNNLVSGLIALAPFSIASTCTSAASQCVSQAMESSSLMPVFPTAPQVFATVFYDTVWLLNAVGLSSPFFAVYWVFVVFLGNSAWDLLNAGRFYVFFDDVEWETAIHDGAATPPQDA